MKEETTDISITARHVNLTEAIRCYAHKKLESILIGFPRVIDAHVILNIQKYCHDCEVVLVCNKHICIRADHKSRDMYTSIDLCMDKLSRQMRKYKTRVQQHRPHEKRHSFYFDKHAFPSGRRETLQEQYA